MLDFRIRRTAGVAAGGLAWALLLTLVLLTSVRSRAQVAQNPPSEQDYGYAYLTDDQRAGRDTWYFWTGGNEKFWVRMAGLPDTYVNLLAYVDSRLHGRRFSTLGAITQPGCRAATAPDQHGLWMDQCDQPPVPGVPGEPTGIVGLRRFPNPDFVAAQWNAEAYLKQPGPTMQPPYRIGMTCGFCHIGFNPLNPPDNPEAPRWANLAGGIGNQYLGRRPAVQPAVAGHGLPLARGQSAAGRDVRYVEVRNRSHQQPERDQLDLQSRRIGRPTSRRWPTAPRAACLTS